MDMHWTTPLKLTAHEMPGGFTVPLRFEEWLLYAVHLADTNDTPYEDAEMKGVSPMHMLQVDNRALREERDKLKVMIQQLHSQANAALGNAAAQVQQMNLFIAGIAHSLGGELRVPHASMDALRAEPHRMHERVDDAEKVTIITVAKADPAEQPAPAEAATDVSEAVTDEKTTSSLISVVSR